MNFPQQNQQPMKYMKELTKEMIDEMIDTLLKDMSSEDESVKKAASEKSKRIIQEILKTVVDLTNNKGEDAPVPDYKAEIEADIASLPRRQQLK